MTSPSPNSHLPSSAPQARGTLKVARSELRTLNVEPSKRRTRLRRIDSPRHEIYVTPMKEIISEVLEDGEGGLTASALGYGIHTQADGMEGMKSMVREAVECYFAEGEEKPAIIRLHCVRDEVLAV